MWVYKSTSEEQLDYHLILKDFFLLFELEHIREESLSAPDLENQEGFLSERRSQTVTSYLKPPNKD